MSVNSKSSQINRPAQTGKAGQAGKTDKAGQTGKASETSPGASSTRDNQKTATAGPRGDRAEVSPEARERGNASGPAKRIFGAWGEPDAGKDAGAKQGDGAGAQARGANAENAAKGDVESRKQPTRGKVNEEHGICEHHDERQWHFVKDDCEDGSARTVMD